MGWATRNFAVGPVVIELPQSLAFSQTYEEFGGVATHRMMAGGAFRQTNWTRLRSSLTAEGMIPPGLKSIDWTQPLVLQCGVTRALSGASNTFVLPAGSYRADTGYTPFGYAFVDGFPVKTTASGLTLTVVPGAAYYVLEYYPTFTAFISPPTVTKDRTTGRFQWSITAEEV